MIAVQGLQAQEGETVFAFLVLRLREPRDREGLVELLRYIAPLIPDVDNFIEQWTEDVTAPVLILATPWLPPEAGHAVDAQRRLIESTGGLGVEAAWFFQTSTTLPSVDDDEADDDDSRDDDDDDDDDAEADDDAAEVGDEDDTEHGVRRSRSTRATTRDDSSVGDVTDTALTTPVDRLSMSDLVEDDDDEGEADREERRTRSVAGEIGSSFDGYGDDVVTNVMMPALPDEDEDDAARKTAAADDDGADDDADGEDDDADADDEDDDDGDDDGDDSDPDEDDGTWSAGPPPEVTRTRFPLDGYPAIVDELDWEDFGIAVKFKGPALPGQAGVLFGFHSLWLAPYGGRYRNTAVTFDGTHNAAHFWVDRFAVPTPAAQQVHHLLWVISQLDEVLPVVHARFAEASMSQKYSGLAGETSEPFVLGGNPLVAAYVRGGEPEVDRWIGKQTAWSSEEIAAMLRELAIEIVTADADPDDQDEDESDAASETGDDDGADEGEADRDEDDDADDPDDEDDAADGRQIASYAGEVLRARAAAGTLHPRAAERLLPVLEQPGRFEHRRMAVVEILGALKYRAAVPAMIRILETTTIKNSLDSIGKEDFLAATAAALGAIGDPAAIPTLARVVAAAGTHNDKPRPVAADALASCLQATPEPRTVDDAVLDRLLETIRERNDGELNAETHFAYGRLVRQLPPERRAEARRRLADADTARDDAIAMLARQAALLLASPTTPIDPPPRDLQPLLRESLTTLDYDHEYTVRNLRVALRVADIVPDLVLPEDLVWLTRFAEADIRRAAHVLLAKVGAPMDDAPAFDRVSAQNVGDHELVRLIAEPHVVGRAALIVEAGRRRLTAATRAIINACHDVISRARQGGENLLDPDMRVLEAAVPILRELPLDGDVVLLFDRMLRHSNVHVKWELVEDPPRDERLLGGMFHVLGEKWGWQEKAARTFLAHFVGTPAYEIERVKAGSPALDDEELADSEADGDDEDNAADDEDMN